MALQGVSNWTYQEHLEFAISRSEDAMHTYMYQTSTEWTPPPHLKMLSAAQRRHIPLTVTPYQLCDECRSFCRALQFFVVPRLHLHYQNGQNVAIMSESGCHLCSMVLSRLRWRPEYEGECQWTEDDTRSLYALVARPSRKKFSNRDNFLVVDYHFADDVNFENRLNTGSVYLHPSEGSSPPQIDSTECMWHTTLAAEPCFDLIRKWMSRCRRRHTACAWSRHTPPPRRLINLAAFLNSQDVRVTDLPSGPTPEYLCLSWRWGSGPETLLKRANEADFHQRIDFETLPKTFRDAVTAARKLGFTHLWIDALCIVQDDDEAKTEDIATMHNVYGGCTATIAAATATDAKIGLLGNRWPLSNHDCWLSTEGNVNLIAAAYQAEGSGRAGGFCPLDQRAWVQQERFLSPRTVYFSDSYIFWECRQKTFHEQLPVADYQMSSYKPDTDDDPGEEDEDTAPIPVRDSPKASFKRLQRLDENCRDSAWELTIQTCWLNVVSLFTRSQLGFVSDKMRAMAGVAAVFRDKTNMQASFGIWRSFFLENLIWSMLSWRGRLEKSSKLDLAPSWSWMSVNQGIVNSWIQSLPNQSAWKDFGRVHTLRAEVTHFPPMTEFTASLYPLAQPEIYAVRIKGPLLPVEWNYDPSEQPGYWTTWEGYSLTTVRKRQLELASNHEHQNRNFCADYLIPPGVQLWCVLIAEEFNQRAMDTDNTYGRGRGYMGTDLEQHGLVLALAEGFVDRYVRVGALVLEGDSSCRACKLFQGDEPVVEIEIV